MGHAFYIKEQNRLPTLARTLEDADGNPIDLSTASCVRFHMRPTGVAAPVIATYASVLSASAGRVEYAWGAGETASVGLYQGEYMILWNTASKTQTVPNAGYIPITVVDAIA